MSFFKKLISREELSEQEIAEKERVKEEKRIRREEENRIREEQRRIEKEQQNAKKEKFIGQDPSFSLKMDYSNHKKSIDYIDSSMLVPGENVLGIIAAEYDKTQKREIKGILVATDHKLIFSSFGFNKEYNEVLEYKKMNGISIGSDGFAKKEIRIDYGQSIKKFDDLPAGKELDFLLSKVREQISLHKSGNANTATSSRVALAAATPNKYEQLEKLGKLKEQGILSDEEFQNEKIKILNN